MRPRGRADEHYVHGLVGIETGIWEVVFIPGCPAVSWTGGDFASDGTEADESYFDGHIDELRLLLLMNVLL